MNPSLLLSPKLRRAAVNDILRDDFVSFVAKTFEYIVPGEQFHLNWHIRAVAHALDRVRHGKCKRLIITLPPRHLKSIMTSVAWPAFLLGHDPTKNIVGVSYSYDLAIKHSIDCRTVMRSEWFRRLFPDTRLGTDKNTELEITTTRGGGRLATSVGGTLTGRGGNIIILDDPMKPEEAMSETSRKRVVQWLETTLLSRLNDKSEDAIILVMQRLHIDDLAGVLIEKGGWEYLNLPAIAEVPQRIALGNGRIYRRAIEEVLDPIREPRKDLDALKASMGTMAFSAQYQQRPIPAEGNLIKTEWLQYYEELPDQQNRDLWVVSWDTAMKATELADYSVATIWLVQGDNRYLVDLVRGRFDYPGLKRTVLNIKDRWPAATILIEDKGSGTSLIQDLRSQKISIINVMPEADKITRLYTCQAAFESGSVLFPKQAPWLDNFLSELLSFPAGRHDDQVDSLSQAIGWLEQRKRRSASAVLGGPILVPNPRPRMDWDNYY